MNAALLQSRDLCVEIGGRRIVDQLNFSLKPGECLAILGCNGAGKSTLLSTLAGLRPPIAGEILLNGQNIAHMAPRQLALQRGWLGQFQHDFFGSTVLETALIGRHPHLGRWAWENQEDAKLAREALKTVGLQEMETRLIHTLSGGERQRLAIATLLTQAPSLYLLDEPLSHLDLNHQMAILRLFSETAQKSAAGMIMVLHDPALAYRFCDAALLLHNNGHTESGLVDDILTAKTLSRLYGHHLQQIEIEGYRSFIPQ